MISGVVGPRGFPTPAPWEEGTGLDLLGDSSTDPGAAWELADPRNCHRLRVPPCRGSIVGSCRLLVRVPRGGLPESMLTLRGSGRPALVYAVDSGGSRRRGGPPSELPRPESMARSVHREGFQPLDRSLPLRVVHGTPAERTRMAGVAGSLRLGWTLRRLRLARPDRGGRPGDLPRLVRSARCRSDSTGIPECPSGPHVAHLGLGGRLVLRGGDDSPHESTGSDRCWRPCRDDSNGRGSEP